MKIVTRGLLPNERTYKARCRNCETEIEFIGKEATDYRFARFFKNWKLIGCPVCERTIKTAFAKGYRADSLTVNTV